MTSFCQKKKLGTRLIQTWGIIIKTSLKTSPLLAQLGCHFEDAYSINVICKPIFFHYQEKNLNCIKIVGRHRKTIIGLAL